MLQLSRRAASRLRGPLPARYSTAVGEAVAPSSPGDAVEAVAASAAESAAAEVTATADSAFADALVPAAVDAQLGFWPSDLALRLVDAVHGGLDLPWWAAIAGSAVAARTALLPLSVYSLRQTTRMQAMKVPLAHIMARGQAGEDPAVIQAEMAALYAAHGTSPARIFLPALAQAPVFISFFWGLRNLAEVRPGASEGGALWFPDLGASDPTYALPLLSTGSAVALLLLAMPPPPPGASAAEVQQQRSIKLVFGGLTLVSLPVALSMPASVLVFWCCNNGFSILYTGSLNLVPGLKDALAGPLPPAAQLVASSTPAAVATPSLGGPPGGETIAAAQEAAVSSLLELAAQLEAAGKRDEAGEMATRAHALGEGALGAEHRSTRRARERLRQMGGGTEGPS